MSTPDASHPSALSRRPRSSSRGPRSRPTTPLRHSSRSRANSFSQLKLTEDAFPLNALEGGFAELSDSLQMLNQNLEELSLMHQSISRFSENFAAFLYGLNMNAFCADFTEAPADAESFRRNAEREERRGSGTGETGHGHAGGHHGGGRHEYDMETTFMTTDTSFVNEPPPPTVKQSAPTPMKPPVKRGGTARGGIARGSRGGRGGTSGIARGRGSVSYR